MKHRHFVAMLLILLLALFAFASCGGDDAGDDSDNPSFTDGDTQDGDITDGDVTDGDTGDCPAGTQRCPCNEDSSCDGGLVCVDSVCTMPAAVGEEGGACYSNGSCDAGLVCNSNDICEPVATDGDVTDGDTTDGDVTDGDVTDGDVTDGDVTDGDVTDGDVTDGDVTDGDVTDGDVTDGDACEAPAGWPPNMDTEPWFAGRECDFPSCNPENENTCYGEDGLWRQTLTTISHTCGAMAELFDPRLKPGNQQVTDNMSFHSVGECDYNGEGLQTGVVKGDTGIFCEVTYEDDTMGGTITVLQAGWAVRDGNSMVGKARVFLFDLPMNTPDCTADYDLIFELQ